jgi:putative transposase
MAYNSSIHHRRSIRLKGYDYSQAGLYFITICVQDRKCLFGKIANDEMILNNAGTIANECWLEIPKHFPNAVLHEHIVMPNHVHGIIELIQAVFPM